MKFTDLIPEIRNGYAVTRTSWNDSEHMVIMQSDGIFIEKHFNGQRFVARVFSPEREGRPFDDWKLVSRKEK